MVSLTFTIILVLAVAIGLQFYDGGEPRNITVWKDSGLLKEHIDRHKDALGDARTAYYNHCLRVASFALYHLGGKVSTEEAEAIEIALAYHDLALWSDNAMAYLEPSYERAKKNVNKDGKEAQIASLPLIHDLIHWHHKFTSFKSSKGARHDLLVNAVRMGDWTDFTLGLLRFGISPGNIAEVKTTLPNSGFHKALMGFALTSTGYKIPLSIMKW
jgi:hypothetical protein